MWYSSNVIPCNRTNCFSSSNFFQASLNTIDPCMIVQERLAGNYDMPLRNFKNQFGVICAWVNEVDSLFYFGTRKFNENLLYWKKPVKFNDLHICSFFNITDCDQNYMQMLNHQINDKKSVGLCSLFSFFFLSSIFRPRPQYCDYFHMKLVDGFLFRVSVDWALKRPGERFKKQAVPVGPHHWMVSCGRRKARWT